MGGLNSLGMLLIVIYLSLIFNASRLKIILKMVKAAEKLFRKYFPKKFKKRKLYRSRLLNKKGIEIGGPSSIFDSNGILPLYDCIKSIDGCNFSNNTIWEGRLEEGKNYYAGNKIGSQFIAEATNLNMITNASYEFVVSCHNLEHIANPISALLEWKRILVNNGLLLLILPHRDRTFDRMRPVTTLAHLVDDYKSGIDEHDLTHVSEIESLHDCEMERPIISLEQLKERLAENFNNRCAHHHVFNARLTAEMLDYAGFQLIDLSLMYHNIIALAQVASDRTDNSFFMSNSNLIYTDLGYPSDFMFSKSNMSLK